MVWYYCECCDYNAGNHKPNYTKHINSKKHKRMVEKLENVTKVTNDDASDNLHNKVNELSEENETLKDKIDVLSTDCETLKEKCNIISNENQKLSLENAELLKRIKSLEESNQKVQIKLIPLDVDRLPLHPSIQHLEGQARGISELFRGALNGMVLSDKTRRMFHYCMNGRKVEDKYMEKLLPTLLNKTIQPAKHEVQIHEDAGYPVDCARETLKNIESSAYSYGKDEFGGEIVRNLQETLPPV